MHVFLRCQEISKERHNFYIEDKKKKVNVNFESIKDRWADSCSEHLDILSMKIITFNLQYGL